MSTFSNGVKDAVLRVARLGNLKASSSWTVISVTVTTDRVLDHERLPTLKSLLCTIQGK